MSTDHNNDTMVSSKEYNPTNITQDDIKIKLSSIFVHFLPTFLKMISLSFYFILGVLLCGPKWLFHLSTNYSLKLNFFVFTILCAIITYIVYSIMKNRVLSQYKKLTPDFNDNNNNNSTITSIDNDGISTTNNNMNDGEKLIDDRNINKNRINSKNGNNNNDRFSKNFKKNKFGKTFINDHKEKYNAAFIDNDDNVDNDTNKSFFSSYLDQFLSAIKIFGYLEKPVFHDLTKNMKTQKLDEGEILLLDNSIGFAIVVEGTLQIFHEVENDSPTSILNPTPNPQTDNDYYKSASMDDYNNGDDHRSSMSSSILSSEETTDSSDGSETDSQSFLENDSSGYIHLKNGLGKYQLLNTVKPGNPVSSLATILTLFTRSNGISREPNSSNSGINTPKPSSQWDSIQNQLVEFTLQNQSKTKVNQGNGVNDSIIPPSSDLYDQKDIPNLGLPMPNILARAGTDCTIAIIPPQAFENLTLKYPRSVCHIIQMILTKIYHVTFQTVHNYLGLTDEIMQIEYLLNKSVDYELPPYLKEQAIKKVLSDMKEQGKENTTRKTMTTTIGKNDSPGVVRRNRPTIQHLPSKHIVLDSRDHLNPGDLLSNVPLSRKEISTNKNTNPGTPNGSQNFDKLRGLSKSPLSAITGRVTSNGTEPTGFSSQQDETLDSTLKMAVVEAIFAYLNINEQNMSLKTPGSHSSQASESGQYTSNGSTLTRRQSDISLISSFASSNYPRHTLRILPSDFAVRSPKVKKSKKKVEYKEEISSSLDYEFAKNEFSEAIQFQYFKQGSTIIEQDKNGKGLYYVIKGRINVTLWNFNQGVEVEPVGRAPKQKKSKRGNRILYTIEEGGIAGYLTSLVNYRSFVGLKAKTDVYVGFLPNDVLERLCDKYFLIYLRLAENLTSLLSPRMLKLDHALEWVHLSASEMLFKQGDPANGIYVVLNGRLRQFQSSNDTSNNMVVGELAQEESFGELEVLTATNRFNTTVAIRDSELARIPRTLFETLALEHPSIMIRVSRLVANKMMVQNSDNTNVARIISDDGNKYDFDLTIPPTRRATHLHSYHNTQSTYSRSRTYRTITILPITDGLPVETFASKLVNAFKQVGRTTIGLNQRTTLTHLGRHAFDRLAKLKQSGYFAELEQMYEIVVYIADPSINSSWTSTCISQGDCILLLSDAHASSEVGKYEKMLLESKSTARTELILLHPETYVEPGLTHKWLLPRPWVDAHHHMRFLVNEYERSDISGNSKIHGMMSLIDKIIQADFSKKTQQNISRYLPGTIRATVENFSSRFMKKKTLYYAPLDTYKDDFLRLARILSGQAIGLVLGGGGAKGISHLGVIQALEEQGIPIDMIGGTSIGSFVGGLYAKDYNMLSIFGRTKKFCGRISSVWRMLTDLTWPVTSYTTGHEFNRGIWKVFGDTRIEDFWLPYFCNSTNITESVQEVHSFGYAWRYIRASMSLAGLLPPLEENGSMLLDGGYVDNLPVLEMKARGCDTIFAIDVGSMDDRTLMSYGDSLNGFWIIFNRLNPFSSHPNIPDLTEIQVRLGYVASVNALEKAKHTKGVIYARPPIDKYNTLEFSKFEEIYKLGLKYGRIFFTTLKEDDKMPKIPGGDAAAINTEMPEFLLHRRNSI
ncbi:similar to Saccharomyces cerevisiae YML059C NTE1 Serine esterase, homolog of human neuropathy target esterase (NTE) [Maudiozyma saulgeensis]|uniref:Lysophospholipase NTE1 n=1 Tax=Maudiozyma saulgeensis TaxID=1789683 RepID=A0A1X7QZU8_9SACH|nr:similar to Saccharomyces cerevisiae YML059C NTE1 Serine esterase, homolog of human neuropathy target esterase (NTE) [Kazachstania saulgeensis]